MNNLSPTPLQRLQYLLNNLSNYISQINSIIKEMNNILFQFNNPLLNQINSNCMPIFNNNFNFNLNEFSMNLNKEENYKPKINVIFDVSSCNENIKNISSKPGFIINIPVDPDTKIHELLIMFFERIGYATKINEFKNQFAFFHQDKLLDFNSEETIKKKIFNVENVFIKNNNIFCNIKVINK